MMGKTPRAAARENETDGAARDEARQPPDVVEIAEAHVMMRLEKPASERKMLWQTLFLARGMKQKKLGQAACPLLEGRHIEGTQGQGLIGARQQQNAIGLAQAKIRPGAVRLVAAIEHHIVRTLKGTEPFGRLLGRGWIEDCGTRAHVGQHAGNALRDRRVREPILDRNDRKGFGARAFVRGARRVVQAVHENSHQIQHHARMARDESGECAGADAQQLRVAQCHQLRRVRFARDQRHLADCSADGHMGDQVPSSMLVLREYAKASRHYQE
jgi:hypothetical protein